MKARRLAPGEQAAAVDALVEAFDRDPFARWLYPDAVERGVAHRNMFSRQIASSDAIVDVTDDLDGAAIWYPPGHYPAPTSSESSVSVSGSSALFESLEAARPPGEFWFLAFLGARTAGHGSGSALVRHRLALGSGPSALWTANESNVIFYGRFGYWTASRHEVPGACAFWLMRSELEADEDRPPKRKDQAP